MTIKIDTTTRSLLKKKLESTNGLCTSVARTDKENSGVVQYIMEAFVTGRKLQKANRTTTAWEKVDSLPVNFEDYKYRVEQNQTPQEPWQLDEVTVLRQKGLTQEQIDYVISRISQHRKQSGFEAYSYMHQVIVDG